MENTIFNDYAGIIRVSADNSSKRLYPHQVDALQKLNEVLNKERYSGLLVLPTGGGKTMTAIRWALRNVINQNKKVLWIAHRHELLNQALRTVQNNAYRDVIPDKKEIKFRVISGLHDRPVNIKVDDDFIIASKDSLNHGSQYLLKWIEANSNNIVLIIDEAHHATAKSYRNLIEILEKHNRNNLHILGLTATPYRTSESEKGLLKQLFKDGITYGIDLKTLISRKFLSDPIFEEINTKIDIGKDLTDKDIKNIQAFDNLPEDVATEIAVNGERNYLIVNHYIENQQKYGKMLLFAININHAIALNGVFKAKGISSDFVISSIKDLYTGVSVSNEENEVKIKKFREGLTQVLINVNILTEGTDLPTIQTIFLTRPTTSTVLMTQMIGRALRGVSVGGTEKAFIVSFIDDWKDKIAWVNPEKLIEYEKAPAEDKSYEKKEHVTRLVAISKIEEFAKIVDESINTDDLEAISFLERVPVGLYSFSILIPSDNEEEYVKNCDIIVYDSFKQAYKDFIEDLEMIFKVKNIEDKEYLDEYELEYICSYIEKEYFEGYINPINYKKEDIKDLLRYYSQKGVAPQFLDFDDRENYDIGKVAKYIWDNDIGIRQQNDYLNSLWNDEKSFFVVFFGNNKKFFLNQVHIELNKLSNPDIYPCNIPQFTNEITDVNKLSLHQLREKDPILWRSIVNEVYEKAKDKEGYYNSSTGKFRSKHRGDFQIDHIVPMSREGLTTLSNLQLLSKCENAVKGDRIVIEDKLIHDNLDSSINLKSEKARTLDEVRSLIKEKKYDEALSKCNDGIKKYFDNYDLYNSMGRIFLAQGEYKESINWFNKAIDIESTNITPYFNKGLALQNLNELDEALKVYNIALKINPNDIETINAIGSIYIDKEQDQMAIPYFDKVIQIDNKNVLSYYNKGIAYQNIKNFNKAVQYYDKAISINTNYSDAYKQKGCIFIDKKKYDDASICFDKMIEIDPKNIEGYRYKGNVLIKKNLLIDAAACFNKAIEICPDEVYAYHRVGYIYQELKRYDDALRYFKKALEVDDKDSNAWFGLAYIFDIEKKYDEAIEYYDKYIDLEPGDPNGYNNKGYTYFKMKQYNKALACYNKAIKVNPTYKRAIQNKKRVMEKINEKNK